MRQYRHDTVSRVTSISPVRFEVCKLQRVHSTSKFIHWWPTTWFWPRPLTHALRAQSLLVSADHRPKPGWTAAATIHSAPLVRDPTAGTCHKTGGDSCGPRANGASGRCCQSCTGPDLCVPPRLRPRHHLLLQVSGWLRNTASRTRSVGVCCLCHGPIYGVGAGLGGRSGLGCDVRKSAVLGVACGT